MISLKTYNKQQLEELINSTVFNDLPFYPITKHRAISHIKNSNATDSDSLLILAFEDDNLAGYIGVLPDNIIHENQNIHLGWLSTLFVHPDFRGKKIAQKLLSKACDEYNGNIMITEFTPEAENMYVKSQLFVYQKTLYGKSYHYLSNLQKILPSKNKTWSKYKLCLKAFDSTLNSLIKLINKTSATNKESFKITYQLDHETASFIDKNKIGNCFNRNRKEIEWIVDNPWILTDNTTINYQFSAYEKRFEYIFIKIYEGDNLNTVLLLSIRDNNAKLHFVFGKNDPITASKVLHQYTKQNNISNLISFDQKINEQLDRKKILLKKDRQRKFLMHKNLQKTLGENFIFDISAGDGDAIFT